MITKITCRVELVDSEGIETIQGVTWKDRETGYGADAVGVVMAGVLEKTGYLYCVHQMLAEAVVAHEERDHNEEEAGEFVQAARKYLAYLESKQKNNGETAD